MFKKFSYIEQMKIDRFPISEGTCIRTIFMTIIGGINRKATTF